MVSFLFLTRFVHAWKEFGYSREASVYTIANSRHVFVLRTRTTGSIISMTRNEELRFLNLVNMKSEAIWKKQLVERAAAIIVAVN